MVLLLQAMVLAAAAVRDHTVILMAGMVVQEAMAVSY
jgi:hypothetical protein